MTACSSLGQSRTSIRLNSSSFSKWDNSGGKVVYTPCQTLVNTAAMLNLVELGVGRLTDTLGMTAKGSNA